METVKLDQATIDAITGRNSYNQLGPGQVSGLTPEQLQAAIITNIETRQTPEQARLVLNELINTGKFAQDAFSLYNDGLVDVYGDAARNYQVINEAFGGYVDHQKLADSSQTTLKAAVDRFDTMADAYGNTTEQFIAFQRDAGKRLDADTEKRLRDIDAASLVTEYFTSYENAADVQSDVIDLLVTQNQSIINEMDEATGIGLALIKQNTGLAADTIAEIMESTMVRTGEVSNDAFFKIAGYAKQMADDTGLSMQMIQRHTANVIKNIEQFGFVTEQEATRISTQLLQLGMRFETFTGLTQKFQDFSSSASMTGDISQLTGGAVQLDAQELAFLASEDQDEFLRELRRSFIDQGFDKDEFMAMTNAEQRALASSIGMERKEFMMLIDRERKISSREELDAAIKSAEDSGKTQEKNAIKLIEEMKPAIDKLDNAQNTIMKEIRQKAMARNRKDATIQIKQLIDLRREMVQAISPPDIMHELGGSKGLQAFGGALLETFSKFNKEGKVLKSVSEGMQYFANIFGGSFESANVKAKEGLGDLHPRSLPPYFVKWLEEVEKGFVPENARIFKIAGTTAATEFKEAFEASGMSAEAFVRNVTTINTTNRNKLIERNIRALERLLESINESDKKKYTEIMENLSESLDTLNANLEKFGIGQEEVVQVLKKGNNTVIEMDGMAVARVVAERAAETEGRGGQKLTTVV